MTEEAAAIVEAINGLNTSLCILLMWLSVVLIYRDLGRGVSDELHSLRRELVEWRSLQNIQHGARQRKEK